MHKAHILQEINRTAAANGGVPLGFRRFFAEAGIKQSDWCGVHWARWNDALHEAGLVPNKLKEAHSKGMLLDKYAKLAREIGRLPSRDELKLQRRKDLTFPSSGTFVAFGSKAGLVAQLADYCRGQEEFADVVRWCQEYTASRSDPPAPSAAEQVEIGFVYLIKSGRFYKIGKTNAAGRREYELAIQLSERPTTVHVIRTDDPSGIEAYWHRRFEAKRKNGEWFDLDAADIAAFKRRKFM